MTDTLPTTSAMQAKSPAKAEKQMPRASTLISLARRRAASLLSRLSEDHPSNRHHAVARRSHEGFVFSLDGLEARAMLSAVNDAPTFTPGSAVISVTQNAPLQEIANWATDIAAGPAEEANQQVYFVVTTDNDALFGVLPSVELDGTLTFAPKPNAKGTANVTVVLKDFGGTADGGVDTSDPVNLTITVTGVNQAPSLASLASSKTSASQGSVLTFTAISVKDSDGNLAAVSFYRDLNKNGTIDAGDTMLGTGTQNGNNWALNVDTTTFAKGANRVLVRAADSDGATSLTRSINVTITAPAPSVFSIKPPTLGALRTSVASTVHGAPLTLTAVNAADADGNVDSVRFFRDANGNNRIDDGDTLLGTGTLTGQQCWSLTTATVGFAAGNNRILADVVDNDGLSSAAKTVNVTLKPVTIGSFTSTAASTVRANKPFFLSANNVAGPVAAVEFYRDNNNDGLITGADTLLGTGTQLGKNWKLNGVTTSLGTFKFLARAVDTYGGFSPIKTLTLNVTR